MSQPQSQHYNAKLLHLRITYISDERENRIFNSFQVQKRIYQAPQNSFILNIGRLVLGQELDDEENGGFSIEQTFSGEMANFVLMNDTISEEDAVNYTLCINLNLNYFKVFDFENIGVFEVHGPVAIFNLTQNNICQFRFNYWIYVLSLLEYDNAIHYCNSMHGQVFYPSSNNIENLVLNNFSSFAESCQGSFSTELWYSIVGDLENKNWVIESTGLKANYTNFDIYWKQVIPGFNCTTIGVTAFDKHWFRTPCNKTACSICTFDENPHIDIKGLCRQSSIEKKLYLSGLVNLKWSYSGNYKTRLIWNDTHWLMYTSIGQTKYVMQEVRWTSLPLGRHKWKVFNDRCLAPEVILKR